MNDKPCVIDINGTEYYYPCDRHDDIILVGSNLVNIGSSTITLYHDFPTYQDNTSGYPRITMPSNTKAYYRASNQANTSTLVVNSVEFKTTSYGLSIYLSIVLILCVIVSIFKK